MRKVKYFDYEVSVEEYIKIQIVKNDGNRSLVYRQDLINECESRNIQTKVTSTKEQLVELLVENGVSYNNFTCHGRNGNRKTDTVCNNSKGKSYDRETTDTYHT